MKSESIQPTVFKESEFVCLTCGFSGIFLTGAQARKAHGRKNEACNGAVRKMPAPERSTVNQCRWCRRRDEMRKYGSEYKCGNCGCETKHISK